MSQVTAIRITEAFILKRISEEQERTGESTATKTATRLLNERLAQMEPIYRPQVPLRPVELATSAPRSAKALKTW